MSVENLLFYTDSIGIVAFTISGFIESRKANLDLLGMFLVSGLTSLGGGIIRDTFLNRPPISFVTNYNFNLVLFTLISVLILKRYFTDLKKANLLFNICDSIGLVSFALGGSLLAIQSDFQFYGVVWLGLITGTGGGIIRDVILRRVSMIFHSGFYGTVCVLIATSLFFLKMINFINPLSILTVFVFYLVIRIMAYFGQWELKKILHL